MNTRLGNEDIIMTPENGSGTRESCASQLGCLRRGAMRYRILGELCKLIWKLAMDFVQGVTRGYAVRHEPRLVAGECGS